MQKGDVECTLTSHSRNSGAVFIIIFSSLNCHRRFILLMMTLLNYLYGRIHFLAVATIMKKNCVFNSFWWLWPYVKKLSRPPPPPTCWVNYDRTPEKKTHVFLVSSLILKKKRNSRCLRCFRGGGGWVFSWIFAWARGGGRRIVDVSWNLCNGNRSGGWWGTGRCWNGLISLWGGGGDGRWDTGGLCKARGSVEVPGELREDGGSVSVEEVRIWSCEFSPSWVVAQIGIFRIVHDTILRERKKEKER